MFLKDILAGKEEIYDVHIHEADEDDMASRKKMEKAEEETNEVGFGFPGKKEESCSKTDEYMEDDMGRKQEEEVEKAEEETNEVGFGFPGPKIREESLATDMECLCLFLKVVGKSMDTPKAHNLMNQYFQRLQRIQARATEASSLHGESEDGSNCSGGRPRMGSGHEVNSSPKSSGVKSHLEVLPARIRFMIDDILDLRSNGWVPRRAGQRGETNKPRYLRDIRMEVFKATNNKVHGLDKFHYYAFERARKLSNQLNVMTATASNNFIKVFDNYVRKDVNLNRNPNLKVTSIRFTQSHLQTFSNRSVAKILYSAS
ncbi:Eukaryotic translation initiation factor 4 gamma 2 [Clonorchis sinensis]|uniref:Eukaryotic translation initiation factor 4 gamma 2 n=1 Tax=Clonorchis sinensis TaxID=79923 RepID=A0A8T1M1N2_CLOSI|nr:Eukaryotic translation initiation factor 4 gamma 2 [Clonorchis sinensis]